MGLFNSLKQKSKSKVKNIIMSVVTTLLIKAAIIICIVGGTLFFLASSWYIVGEDTVVESSKSIRGEENKPSVVIKNNERVYELDTEFSDRVTKALKNLSIDPDAIGLTPELAEKMYKAEIFTSYPDLREREKIGTKIEDEEMEQEKLQGCIQFHRINEDGTKTILEYMDFNAFQTILAELGCKLPDKDGKVSSQGQIYTKKEDVEKRYNYIREYFTLDEEYNLILATIDTTLTKTYYNEYAEEEGNEDKEEYTYTVSYKKINYQTELEEYALPLEFTISMLVIGQNPGFCEAIVELVKESKIIIEVQDNLVTTNITETYDYAADFNIEKNIQYTTIKYVPKEEQEGETPISPDEGSGQENENVENSVTVEPEENVQVEGNVEEPTTPNEDVTTPTVPNEENKEETPTEEEEEVELVPKEEPGEINLTGSYQKGKNMNDPYRKKEIKIVNMNTNLYVKNIDIWIVDNVVDYEKIEKTTETNNTTYIDDDTDFVEVVDYHDLLQELIDEVPEGANIIRSDESVKEKQTEKELNVITNTKVVDYEKVKIIKLDKSERFLSLLSIDPKIGEFNKSDRSKNKKLIKYEDVYGKKSSPEDNILSSTQILFDYLALSEKTQRLEEIMRYLLYVYTGIDYGVTEFDFSIYEPGKFDTINTISSLEKFKEYLHAWEGCTTLSEDGTMYKIEIDAGGNPTVGYGVDVNANKQTFINAGYSTNTGDYIPKDFVDALEDEIINRNIEIIEAKTSSLDLTQYQIYALASRMYNCGETGAFGVRNGKTFIEAYNTYWNQDRDTEYKEIPDTEMYTHSLYTQYMCEPITSNGQELAGLLARRKSEWILFKTGYFDRTNEYCSELAGSAGAILESAETIHYYMEQNNYSYYILGGESNSHAGGHGLDATFEESKTNHKLTCCATYVSWVLREAGYINITCHSSTQLANYLLQQGFEQVNYSEIEAGDIVFMRIDGQGIEHTQIYAGDGQWYNAGSEKYIRQSAPYTKNISSNSIIYVLRAP